MNLSILNDGSPTFWRGQQETAIDISLASSTIANRLMWKIDTDLSGSDHFPIWIHTNNVTPETSRRPRWRYNQADWSAFQLAIANKMESNPTSIEELSNNIYEAAVETIPRTSSTPGRRALHWWSDEVKKAVKKRRKTLRAAKRLPFDHPYKESAMKAYREAHYACRQFYS